MNKFMLKRRLIVLVVVALVLIVGFGVFSTYLQPRERHLRQVNVGHFLFISYAPVWVAQEKGFFREEGLNVTLKRHASAEFGIKALIAGEVDILHSSFGGGFWNAILKGADLKILTGEWTVRGGVPGDNSLALIVRKDLHEAGVRNLQGLVGKKIGTGPQGSPGDVMLMHAAKAENIPFERFDPLRTRPDLAASAMEARTLDAFIWGEPFATLMLEKGHVALKGDADLYPPGSVRQLGGAATTNKFIRENQELVKAYLNAYRKGVDYYVKGLGEGPTGSVRNEIAGIVEKYTGISKGTVIKAKWSVILPGGVIDIKGLLTWQEDLAERKVQDGIVPVDKLIVPGISLLPP